MVRFGVGVMATLASAVWALSSLDGISGIITAVLVGGAGLVVAVTGLVKVLHEVRTNEAAKAAALVSAAAVKAAALVTAAEQVKADGR